RVVAALVEVVELRSVDGDLGIEVAQALADAQDAGVLIMVELDELRYSHGDGDHRLRRRGRVRQETREKRGRDPEQALAPRVIHGGPPPGGAASLRARQSCVW